MPRFSREKFKVGHYPNIGNICGGAVPEQFEHEMRRILANIADPNTDPA